MVTINDIARQAGVSRGTVDRVLNNRSRVSPEKKELVQKIADEMGYQPNLVGKGLAVSKKKLHFGFLSPESPGNCFFEEIREGAKTYAEELKQYGVEVTFLTWTRETMRDAAWAASLLREHDGMDGWVMDGVSAACFFQAARELLLEKPVIVTCNIDEAGADRLAFVGCDYEESGKLACGLAAMMSRKQGKVGIIAYDDGTVDCFSRRLAGFEREMETLYPEMRVVEKRVLGVGADQYDFFSCVKEMLQEHEELEILYLVNPGDYAICYAVYRAQGDRQVGIITNDLAAEEQWEMVRKEQITAVVCQEPQRQGKCSLEILFRYLAYGIGPEEKRDKIRLSVHIRQNV